MARKHKRLLGSRSYRNSSKEKLEKALGKVDNNPGRPTIFTHDGELAILKSAAKCADWGFPLSLLDMRMMAKYYFGRKRHKKSHRQRISTNIKRARASVSKETLGEFYDNLENTLRVLPSNNIFNYDESNLSDDPGKKRGIYRRGVKYPEKHMDKNLTMTKRGELGIEDRPASVSSICDVGEEEANSEDFEVGQFILGTFFLLTREKT
ncbi:hypothetical protein JTB14_025122 [Gonioctena quinquepunctata]|nr:hypothetical protein JTB14_025122 [Gonioctena quinquepunctata]